MRYDLIIVGSGIAGLYAALLARDLGSVLLLTKGSIQESNTRYAQGGIAAALGPDDSSELHFEDTLQTGAGLVDEDAARILAEDAPDRIRDLVDLGVTFDTTHGEVALGREAAHSKARILHAGGDATGAHIELSLSSLAQQSGIEVAEHSALSSIAVDCGRVTGVEVLDVQTGAVRNVAGESVVLATGGCGQLYRHTTNPSVATGDGIAVAFRAGAEVQDMEFVQFHPTALRVPGAPVFLISEALRGEGALLIDSAGRRFMPEHDTRAELAPRDVVARAIHQEMRQSGSDHVFLDISHLLAERVVARFPQIFSYCLRFGIDITKDLIPVAPAAHYMMGGVRTNIWGETTVEGLYACGECACTSVHGANRLASNSLLETVVFAKRVIERIASGQSAPAPASEAALHLTSPVAAETDPPTVDRLQNLMWEHVGIVRNGGDLESACAALSSWASRSDAAAPELQNLTLCGRLVAQAALIREESRGAHYRSDFPEPQEEWRRHIVFRRDA
jgi:L-aspartate oxidase